MRVDRAEIEEIILTTHAEADQITRITERSEKEELVREASEAREVRGGVPQLIIRRRSL